MDLEKYISSGVLEQYVLGLCSPEETEQVQQYAETHPEIKQKIKKLECCMEHYANLHAISPPSQLKNKALSNIDSWEECKGLSVEYKKEMGEETPMTVPQRNYGRLLAGLAAMMIFSLGFLSYSLYQKQNESNAELRRLSAAFNTIKAEHQGLKQQNNQLQAQDAVLKDVGTRQIRLKGSNMVPQGLVVIYYNSDHKKTYLNIVNLPEPPSDHQYQLWADVNGTHHSMGAVQVSGSAEELHHLPFMENSNGFAITLEIKGGSKVPTIGRTCLSGSL